MNYHAYMQSPEWRRRREAALQRAGHRCQVCNGSENLQAHHRTYENLGNELPGDLTVLCDECHRLFSRRRQERPCSFLARLGWVIEDICHD